MSDAFSAGAVGIRRGGEADPASRDRTGIRLGVWMIIAEAGLIGSVFACCITIAFQLFDRTIQAGWGLSIDRLGAAAMLLVCSIGAATFAYAERCLEGDPVRGRFLRRLICTIGASAVFMLAVDLPVLFAAWSLTSLGLHLLLTNDPNRPESARPARKKFLISRLGDLALIAAIILIRAKWGTFELDEFLQRASAADGPAFGAVGILIVAAALTKSAQFPFHSWLPDTMESPTPVSILMHAGIINAGGILLLRFAPVIAPNPAALLALSIVGTLTMSLGMIAMWAQVKAKRTLAWSTVSQMGFMMVQCGLGAFASAALHIIGHGFYKAWSFARAGKLESKGGVYRSSPAVNLAWVSLGVFLSVPAFALATFVTGFSPLHSPGELALTFVTALSIGQVWASLFSEPVRKGTDIRDRLGIAAGLTVGIAVAAFGLYQGAQFYLSPMLGGVKAPTGPAAWIAAAIPSVALAALTVLHAFLPTLGKTAWGRAFHVHALNGFYFGVIADQITDRVWNLTTSKKEVDRG